MKRLRWSRTFIFHLAIENFSTSIASSQLVSLLFIKFYQNHTKQEAVSIVLKLTYQCTKVKCKKNHLNTIMSLLSHCMLWQLKCPENHIHVNVIPYHTICINNITNSWNSRTARINLKIIHHSRTRKLKTIYPTPTNIL